MGKDYYPPSHTAEHILNQTMIRMFGIERSFSNHIERKKSKCDYRFDRDLTEKEIKEIESRVNEVIDSELDVGEESVSLDEALGVFNLAKLPDQAGDAIRIVRIGDYDACPCIGDHVSNTSEIGNFKIISTGFEDGVLRIRFKINSGDKNTGVMLK